VDRDAARHVTQLPVGVGLPLQRHRQVGVFHHDEFALLRAEMPDLFLRVGLGHHLAAHLRAAEQVPADEGRIDAAHERVVDLEIAQRVDALALHEIERAAARQRPQRTAVAVRADNAIEPWFPTGSGRRKITAGIRPCRKKCTRAGSSPK
jgi:hypothetical protein